MVVAVIVVVGGGGSFVFVVVVVVMLFVVVALMVRVCIVLQSMHTLCLLFLATIHSISLSHQKPSGSVSDMTEHVQYFLHTCCSPYKFPRHNFPLL